jgi:ACR3 family arsenite efflux pump ArsB
VTPTGREPSRATRLAFAYPELLLVLVAAVVGLTVGRPLRWADDHQGINILLFVLVFATAVTVSTDALGRLRSAWPQLTAALAVGALVLAPVSWLASRVVTAGSLRHGIMAIGLAPCEIASVATTGLAGGDPHLAAAVLIGSTALSVALAGPWLSFEAGSAPVHSAHILVDLALVVAVPLAAGLVLQAKTATTDRVEATATTDRQEATGSRVATGALGGLVRRAKTAITVHREATPTWVATGALGGLVALVAAEVHLGTAYLAVLGAVAIIVGVSAVIGAALGRTTTPQRATPLLLTISMRDFAIAAGLATAAFGPSAAAPLGVYGVVVIVWGTAVAGRMRAKQAGVPPGRS